MRNDRMARKLSKRPPARQFDFGLGGLLVSGVRRGAPANTGLWSSTAPLPAAARLGQPAGARRTARSVMSSACSAPAAWAITAASIASRSAAAEAGGVARSESSRSSPYRPEAPRASVTPSVKASSCFPLLQPRQSDLEGHVGHQTDGRAGGGEPRPHAGRPQEDRRVVPAVDVGERAGRGIEHGEVERREHVRAPMGAGDVIVGQPDDAQQIHSRVARRSTPRRSRSRARGCGRAP